MAQQILYWQLPPQLPAPSFLLQSPFFSMGETGGSQTKTTRKEREAYDGVTRLWLMDNKEL